VSYLSFTIQLKLNGEYRVYGIVLTYRTKSGSPRDIHVKYNYFKGSIYLEFLKCKMLEWRVNSGEKVLKNLDNLNDKTSLNQPLRTHRFGRIIL